MAETGDLLDFGSVPTENNSDNTLLSESCLNTNGNHFKVNGDLLEIETSEAQNIEGDYQNEVQVLEACDEASEDVSVLDQYSEHNVGVNELSDEKMVGNLSEHTESIVNSTFDGAIEVNGETHLDEQEVGQKEALITEDVQSEETIEVSKATCLEKEKVDDEELSVTNDPPSTGTTDLNGEAEFEKQETSSNEKMFTNVISSERDNRVEYKTHVDKEEFDDKELSITNDVSDLENDAIDSTGKLNGELSHSGTNQVNKSNTPAISETPTEYEHSFETSLGAIDMSSDDDRQSLHSNKTKNFVAAESSTDEVSEEIVDRGEVDEQTPDIELDQSACDKDKILEAQSNDEKSIPEATNSDSNTYEMKEKESEIYQEQESHDEVITDNESQPITRIDVEEKITKQRTSIPETVSIDSDTHIAKEEESEIHQEHESHNEVVTDDETQPITSLDVEEKITNKLEMLNENSEDSSIGSSEDKLPSPLKKESEISPELNRNVEESDNSKTDSLKADLNVVDQSNVEFVAVINEMKEKISTLSVEKAALEQQVESALKQIRFSEQNISEHEELQHQLQEKLTTQMTARAEVESKLKSSMASAEGLLSELESSKESLKSEELLRKQIEDDLTEKNKILTDENKRMAFELAKARQRVEILETNEISLTARLNEAKKIEAAKSRESTRISEQFAALEDDMIAMKNQNTKQETLHKGTSEKMKILEESLDKERQLNISRKSKMKSFVDQKASEIKSFKEINSKLEKEVSTWREEKLGLFQNNKDLEANLSDALIKLDMFEMKNREFEDKFVSMESTARELQRESDDLKKKRLTAKHETMALLRSLESERSVSSKLKHEIKYTLLPKSLSQQELLSESLEILKGDLEILTKTKFASQASFNETTFNSVASEDESSEGTFENGQFIENIENNVASMTASENTQKGRNKSQPEYIQLLIELEAESKKVSMGILALTTNVDRLHELTVHDMNYAETGDKTCASAIAELLMGKSVRHKSGYSNVHALNNK